MYTIHKRENAWIPIYVHKYVYIRTHVSSYMYMYIYAFTCVYVHICICELLAYVSTNTFMRAG